MSNLQKKMKGRHGRARRRAGRGCGGHILHRAKTQGLRPARDFGGTLELRLKCRARKARPWADGMQG
jgi:hypothetical protein